MSFPKEKRLSRIRKDLEKVEGFLMLDPDADELARFRFRICQDLLKYAQRKNFKDVEMAEFLEIPKADMSRIFNHRIDKFSTDKLIKLYSKINPDYKLKVS
ncbi:MAG: XRE family transcriptional regulator [Pseudobdellovibrionaceae bacterium]|nr:XRE family transcriptional regulator [Bdellovibrionales bacterium]USN46368.1 MAG: XRE family transcriptional regulator [Pseudobdellovibrionaceae bacterium]